MVNLQQAKKVSQGIVDTGDPFCVVAFGSVATQGWGNDLDLLIITEDYRPDSSSAIHRRLKPFYKEFAIDPFIVTRSQVRKEFRKGSPFLRLIQRTGRCLYMKESVKIWKERAAEDLDTARYLLEGKYFRSACYHAQQAIEKSIKGALIQKGWELEKTHSIERLVAIGEDFDIHSGISEEEQTLVDSVYRGRYPAEEGLLPTGDPERSEAENIVQIADRVFQKLFS